MKTRAGIFFSRHWDALLAAAAACMFIYLFTRVSGIGISPDSVHYESAAQNIRDSFSFTDFNGKPLVDFPLGYPCFLALASWLSKHSVLQVAPFLNAILLSGVILLTGVLMESFQQRSRIYRIAILSLLACSPALLEIYAMLWSETLFLFLSLLFLVALKNYSSRPRTRALLFAACIAALACVTRYAGITLVGTGLFMIFFNGSIPRAKKIKHVLLFGITGISFVLINLIRNKIVAGHSTGVREKALRSVFVNLQQAGGVLAEWFPFLKDQQQLATLLFVLVMIIAICVLVYRLLQQQYFVFTENIVGCFFVAYGCFIIGMASISRFEDLSSRLLSPMYVTLLLTITTWLTALLKNAVRFKKRMAAWVLLALFAAMHLHHYRLNADAWEGIKDSGMPGYAEGSWRESPAVAMVRAHKNKIAQPIYANANDAVYFLAGIHALALPHKEIQSEIDAFLQHGSFSVIWFIEAENSDLVSLDFIKQHKKLVAVEEAEGGAIYHFSD